MAQYVKATNFASKDALLTGDPNKIIKGAEIDDEFNNIQTGVNSKADTLSPTLTGTPLAPTATAGTNTTQLATTAFVTTAVTNGVANGKVSPAFSGTPTAPTAAVHTNNTQIATTAFVNAEIANDITAPLALKAPLASPALTGTPTAPTAATATNTTQVATTAFVKAQQGAIAITGGTITGTSISGLPSALEIASGGTGLTSVGTDGQVLTSTGTAIAWETPDVGYTDADVKDALNATGSAPIYACRAWANVSGESTIRASGNIASISGGGGIYTVTFGSAMPDVNYAVVISASNNSSSPMSTSGHTTQVYNQTTTSFQIALWNYVGSNNTSSRTSTGLANMGISVFR